MLYTLKLNESYATRTLLLCFRVEDVLVTYENGVREIKEPSKLPLAIYTRRRNFMVCAVLPPMHWASDDSSIYLRSAFCL